MKERKRRRKMMEKASLERQKGRKIVVENRRIWIEGNNEFEIRRKRNERKRTMSK